MRAVLGRGFVGFETGGYCHLAVHSHGVANRAPAFDLTSSAPTVDEG